MAQQEAESGSTPEAISHYTQALESFHANGDVNDELEALEALAALSLQSEDYGEVLAYIDRGTALAQQANNPQREAHLLVLLGDLQMSLGRDDGAEAAYKEAINAYRPTESWIEIAQVLDKLATLYLEQDRLSDAAVVLEQTIPIFERVDHTEDLQAALDRLGDVQADLMHWDEALSYHVRALQIALEAGDDQYALEQLIKLGSISEESGDREGALPYYQQALHLAFKLDDKTNQGEIMLTLGRLLIDDTIQLHRVVQLLEAATELLPDDVDAKRLLRRAKAREERLTSAGVTLLLVENSLEDYARDAAGVSSGDEL
jgi:tetratricopeptide (TPR) repeat protein